MKIYNRIKLDIDTWEVLEEDSFEYEGPLALTKGGGGGGGDSVDKAYNRRMAKIAERQQDMAEEYFGFWQMHQAPTEEMQQAANRELIPEQTALQKGQLQAEQRLLGAREKEEGERLRYNTADLQARRPLAAKYYMEAMNGDNVNRAAAQAGAGVAQEYDKAKDVSRRDAARAGADVNSARFRQGLNTVNLSRARDIAGQSTMARQAAKDANFGKLEAAMNKPLGGA